MVTLEGVDCIEMSELMQDIEVEGMSCDDQSYTIISTVDNEIGDEVYTVSKKSKC